MTMASTLSQKAQPFAGWRIAEAMRRCADPQLLSQWFADHRAWKAGGRRSSFMYRNEDIEGYEAIRHNNAERALHALLDRNERSYARLQYSLIKRLMDGDLTSWGRRESPINPPISIPASAWEYLVICDVRKSIVREGGPDRTNIFDIRIVRAPESADFIDQQQKPPKVGVCLAGEIKTRAGVKGVVTKTTSRDACYRWLCELIRENPEKRPKPKDSYWQDAQEKWPRKLSRRAFDVEWDKAIQETRVFKWSKGGRPPKPPQSKSPHQ